MTPLETRLYFLLPPLSLRDIRIALNFVAAYGDRPGFLDIVQTQSRSFDNFSSVFQVLKEFHGPKEEASKGQNETQEKTPSQKIKEALAQEKALKPFSYKEKEKVFQVKKKFGARFVYGGNA